MNGENLCCRLRPEYQPYTLLVQMGGNTSCFCGDQYLPFWIGIVLEQTVLYSCSYPKRVHLHEQGRQ